MASELKITAGIQYANGALVDNVNSKTYSITQTGLGFHGTVVVVGQSGEEDLVLGDIAAANNGYVYLLNLDSTHFVKFGPKDTTMTEFGRLGPGEFAILRLAPSVTLRWIADTADVKVLVKAYQA